MFKAPPSRALSPKCIRLVVERPPNDQVSLCHLVVLSLKSCKLRRLGDDVAELGCLKELYLDTNLILSLPQTFTRLRMLEVTTGWCVVPVCRCE